MTLAGKMAAGNTRTQTSKIITMTTMLLIIASVVVTCLETMEYFSSSESIQNKVIKVIEVICIIWFTIEFLLRAIVCPSKRDFSKKIMNWLDLAAIVPFYVQLFFANSNDVNTIVTLRTIRLIRVFRVFKLCRHSYSLQILGHTLKSSLSELFLLGFFLSIGVVVFSSLIYYAESDSKKTQFTSIPAGFWWAVITMTTVGYGDFVPSSWLGRLVGTCCAICGVLTIALPIPVIVSNFSLYYSHAKARQKSLKKKRPLVIGAANALKMIEPLVGPRPTHQKYNTRTWPTAALEMAGISFEGGEPSPNLPRRSHSAQLIARRLSHGTHHVIDPEMQQTVIDIISRESGETRCEEEQRGTTEENYIQGARDNEGAVATPEPNQINEEFKLPSIEIHRTSSCSPMSSSNDEIHHGDGNVTAVKGKKVQSSNRKRGKNKSKKTRFSADGTPPVIAQTPPFPNKSPAGRMGRRDSVFVVGFIGKKWMAKAAKSRNISNQNRVLDVNKTKQYSDLLSPTHSVRNTPTFDAMSMCTATTGISTPDMSISPVSQTFHHQFPSGERSPGPSFDRRSSCPCLQGNMFELSANLHVNKQALKSSPSYSNSEVRYVNPTSFNIQEDITTKPLEGGNLGTIITASSGENESGCEPGPWSSPNVPEDPSSNACNESSRRGSGRASPLIRQRALFSTDIQVHDSEDDNDKATNQTSVFKQDVDCCTKYNKPYVGIKTKSREQSPNQKSKLTERRNVPELSLPVVSKNTKSNFDIATNNREQETMAKTGPALLSSTGTKPVALHSEKTFHESQDLKENCHKMFENAVTSQNRFAFQNTATQNEQDYKNAGSCTRNVPSPSGVGSHDVPLYNHVPLTRASSSPQAYRNSLESPRKREQSNSMIKRDSGVYSVETKSSMELSFNFAEEEERGVMDTINETEKSDYLNAGCILRLPFMENCQCEKTTNYIMTIKDETVV